MLQTFVKLGFFFIIFNQDCVIRFAGSEILYRYIAVTRNRIRKVINNSQIQILWIRIPYDPRKRREKLKTITVFVLFVFISLRKNGKQAAGKIKIIFKSKSNITKNYFHETFMHVWDPPPLWVRIPIIINAYPKR